MTVTEGNTMNGADTIATSPARPSWLLRLVEGLATFAVLLLLSHTLLNVFMRYVMNSPVRGTNEVVAYWYMPLIAFAGFIFAQAYDRHISANLIYDMLPGKVQREVLLGGLLLSTALCGIFAWYTLQEALHSYSINRRVTGTNQVIVWPTTFAAPVAYAVMAVLLAISSVRVMMGQNIATADESGIVKAPKTATPARQWLVRGAVVAALAVGFAIIFWPEQQRETIAAGAILMMVVLLFLKVPVAFALAGPGLLGLWVVRPRAVFTMLEAKPYEAVASWSFSVLPMFIFMGLLLWKSGLTTRIYEAARHWLSWLPGGLAVSTNTAGTGLAAVSGSTLGTTYALSRIGIPEMLNAGYDRRLAVGSVMVAGLPGQLIPPSTFLVIYAGIAEVPIGPQLMAGIGPGMMVAAVFSLAMVIASTFWPRMAGKGSAAEANKEKSTWNDRWRSLAPIWPLPVLIGIVLGGMYSGVLTATEAGAAGAGGALLLTIILQRSQSLGSIIEAGVETVIASGAIFLLIIGAEILSSMLTLSGLANGFAEWVANAGFTRIEFLLIVMVAYLILGMFMDPLPMMLLTVPLLIPILGSLDVSLLWFGVFAVFMAELGILTPPVGILSFIIHGIVQDKNVNMGQDISLGDVFTAVGAFMPIAILAAILLILFPEVATFIPDSMSR